MPQRKSPANLWVPPGHYYSPIPSEPEVRERHVEIFEDWRAVPVGIETHDEEQERLGLELLEGFRVEDFSERPTPGRRYYWRNDFFPLADAFTLGALVEHERPRRIIEIGSGYSSAALLDALDRMRAKGLQVPEELVFVDPEPQRLESLLRAEDRKIAQVLPVRIQDLPLERILSLEAGDFLVIDSSHVVKTGSDLHLIFRRILPALKPGVWIQFHDIPWPFEYPSVWVYEGRAWNEAYVLATFLQFNDAFKIRFHYSFIAQRNLDMLRRTAPLLAEQPGTAIWIQRVR